MKKKLARFASQCALIVLLWWLRGYGLSWPQLVIVWVAGFFIYMMASIEHTNE